MTTLELPQESRERTAFFNSVYGVQRDIQFRSWNDVYRLRFPVQGCPCDPTFCFQISGNESGHLWVSLSETSKLAGLEHWLGTAELEELPPGLAAIVLDSYLAATLEEVGALVGESLAITDVRLNGKPADCSYTLPFVLTSESGEQTRGALHFDQAWAPTIQSLLSTAPPIASTALNTIRVPTSLEVGQSSLTLEQWQQLEPADVVMLDRSEWLTRQQVIVRFPPALRVCCTVQADRLVVQRVETEELTSPDSPTELPNVNELQTPLFVRAGKVAISIEELADLAPGDSLSPLESENQTVELVVANQVVGTGELVRSGDRLGVRVIEFTTHPLLNLMRQVGSPATARSDDAAGT